MSGGATSGKCCAFLQCVTSVGQQARNRKRKIIKANGVAGATRRNNAQQMAVVAPLPMPKRIAKQAPQQTQYTPLGVLRFLLRYCAPGPTAFLERQSRNLPIMKRTVRAIRGGGIEKSSTVGHKDRRVPRGGRENLKEEP